MRLQALKLNLGCCDDLKPGWVNVDRVPPADVIADLRERWPWEDSTVDEIYAKDVLEHLPDKIHSLNEAWRVLRPGGRLTFVVPTTDGRGAWQDPTHVSFWTPYDHFYYTEELPGKPWGEWKRFAESYGIRCLYRVHQWDHRETAERCWKLTAVWEALK